jgi:hypothetical protein
MKRESEKIHKVQDSYKILEFWTKAIKLRNMDDRAVAAVLGGMLIIPAILGLFAYMQTEFDSYYNDRMETLENLTNETMINNTINNAIFNAVNTTLANIEYTNSTIIITIPNAANNTLYRIPK